MLTSAGNASTGLKRPRQLPEGFGYEASSAASELTNQNLRRGEGVKGSNKILPHPQFFDHGCRFLHKEGTYFSKKQI